MTDISPIEYATYAGVYQAYAWEQGYRNEPVTFRIPGEYFYFGPDEGLGGELQGFDLKRFMMVVDDMDDEGAIHFWRYSESHSQFGGDRFLMLVCTEDDSFSQADKEFGLTADDFVRPHTFFNDPRR